MTNEMWIKSSYSGAHDCVEVDFARSSYCESAACVEVAYAKSSASAGNGACVEVGTCDCGPGEVRVRDSKDKDGPVLSFSRSSWRDFVDSIKVGVIG
jgi:hypothetical protein